MKLLVLGGTADARHLTQGLLDLAVLQYSYSAGHLGLIYSVAGLVRTPSFTQSASLELISGGFSQYGGLASFVKRHKVQGILDATHPYAIRMTEKARQACAELKIQYWRFQRPAWVPTAKDKWRYFSSWQELLEGLDEFKSIFFSAGQLTADVVNYMNQANQIKQGEQHFLVRTAAALRVQPELNLNLHMTWVKGIGPFNYQDERRLIEKHNVDVLISKDSGGSSTFAKCIVARDLNIPVFLLRRPCLPAHTMTSNHLKSCLDDVSAWLEVQCRNYLGSEANP